MSVNLLVPGEVNCVYKDKCKDRKFNKCSKCINNKKNKSEQIRESFFELIKERR